MIVKRDDVVGAQIGTDPLIELVCEKCLTKEEWEKLEEDEIITGNERDRTDDLYFCARCKKQF